MEGIMKMNERTELYERGLSDKEISNILNLSRPTIRYWRNHKGLPPNRARNPRKIKEINKENRIYLAGFFDGEGYGSIKHHKNDCLVPTIEITNSNKEVILWIKKIIGTGNLKIYNKESKNNWKPYFRIMINGLNDVKCFAEQIVEHCIVKKKLLLLIINFCESRLNKPAHIHYIKEEYGMYEKVKKLNKRGVLNGEGESNNIE